MDPVLGFDKVRPLFANAKNDHRALPAVNVINSNTVNAVLEAATNVNSPVIVQFSHGGSSFFIGKSVANGNHIASIAGAVAGAKYVHSVCELYPVPILINTDHASKELLPWVDGMIAAGEKHFSIHGAPLFTSHMLDLSQEPLKENVEISKRYLERLTSLNMYLEVELGVTGGEEDGVDNTGLDRSRFFTNPEDVAYVYEELTKVSDHFVIAASFGNVHGVYKPGNVQLEPQVLKRSQTLVKTKYQTGDNPLNFVFHGGSGSDPVQIKEAIEYGVVKINFDTDMQWAFWQGVLEYYDVNKDHLQTQLGNSRGADTPNKKFYDPRSWLRKAEISSKVKLESIFHELNW